MFSHESPDRRTHPRGSVFPRKKLLTGMQGGYTLVSAIHKGRLCCAILRAPQPIPASKLSEWLRQRCPGGFFTPPETGTPGALIPVQENSWPLPDEFCSTTCNFASTF
jgi:hypothetical protein